MVGKLKSLLSVFLCSQSNGTQKEQNLVLKHEQYVYLSLSSSSFLSCILMFFLSVCFVHILYVAWTGMTVSISGISFCVSVTWPQTHPQYPTPRVPQMVLVLLLPFSKPHWNEQLNPTDVSERPRSKPEGGREGQYLYRGSFQADYWRAAKLFCQGVPIFEVFQTIHLPLVLNTWNKNKR